MTAGSIPPTCMGKLCDRLAQNERMLRSLSVLDRQAMLAGTLRTILHLLLLDAPPGSTTLAEEEQQQIHPLYRKQILDLLRTHVKKLLSVQ